MHADHYTVLIEDDPQGYMQDRITRVCSAQPHRKRPSPSFAHAAYAAAYEPLQAGGRTRPAVIIPSVKRGLYASVYFARASRHHLGNSCFPPPRLSLIADGKVRTGRSKARP